MSRPNARRRPTHLRVDSHEQSYVQAAAIATSLSLTGASFLWHRLSADKVTATGDALFLGGLVPVAHCLQQRFLPLQRGKEKDAGKTATPAAIRNAAIFAIGVLSSFMAMQRLGPLVATAFLLPVAAMRRCHQLGFFSHPSSAQFALVAGALALIGGSVWTSTDMWQTVGGLLAAAITIGSALQSQVQEIPDWTILATGGSLMAASVLGASIGLTALSGSPILIAVAGLSVVARAWQPTSPRAINALYRIGWPIAVLSLLIVSTMPHHYVLLALMVCYGALFFFVPQNATAPSASTTIANAIPSAKAHASAWGGYYISEITKEKESRDIFYFLLLNLSFMFVQMMYGIWTNSLGLISDSIHMLFDCLALAVGLIAAVMARWPASKAHPFGFVKVEIISGFANSIFLVLISFSIVMEALERLMEPPEMKTDQLLLVSTLGLLVNLVGLFCFGHAHHGHSHSHGPAHEHGHSHAPAEKETVKELPSHSPKLNRDNAYDVAMGHASSPMQQQTTRVGRQGALQELDENVQPGFPAPHGKLQFDRSVSPVRRPGSPLKQSASFGEREELPEKHAHEHEHSHGHAHEHEHHHVHEDKHEKAHDHHDHKHTQTNSHSHDHNHSHGHNHNHSHSHSHHHHDHKHDDHHDHSHGHSHGSGGCSGGHGHAHNLEGIFLHVLADTLGSAGVIVSTLLIRYFGWTGFDPLASIFIAVLIFLSVVPLLKSSFADLMVLIESDQEYAIREALGEASLVTGVGAIPFIRFWNDGERHLHGMVTITAGIDGDLEAVRVKVRRKLEEGIKGLSSLVVQVDRGA